MATYKLIQDVEAEDHILGPLTLRQFIFALIAVFCWYLSFITFVKHVYFLLIITVPPALFFSFFAIPFGRDQPTEVWALAKLRFWFKPRRRIWDQSGIKELVTITVPKKVERILTKGYSQSEVQSRLKGLANTLDSRGWAVKNINLEAYTPGNAGGQGSSDRLIDIGRVMPEVPSYDVQASDDILDETSNPVARQFQTMINQSTKQHRQQLINELNQIREGQTVATQTQAQTQAQAQTPANMQTSNSTAANWFAASASPAAPGPAATNPAAVPVVAPQAPAAQMPAAASNQQASVPSTSQPLPGPMPSANSNLRTLQPLGSNQQTNQQAASQPAQISGAAAPDPAIISLANNNDLNVSTLAREAYKAKHADEPPQNEVVVSLH